MKIILDDRTERFLGWWAEARNCSDHRQAWSRWKTAYQLFPFGPTPEGEAEALAMFAVAFPQYERVLPRIMKRGHISAKVLKSIVDGVSAQMEWHQNLEVHVTLGPAFINPMHYSFARDGRAYIFFPTDYPFRYPHAVLAQLMASAIHHAVLGFDTPMLSPNLFTHALNIGLSVNVSSSIFPGVAIHEQLQGDTDWYAQCQAYEEELIGDFLLAGNQPEDPGLFRAFFWPSDFLPLERVGVYVGTVLVREAVRIHGLQHVIKAGTECWPALLREAGSARLESLRRQQVAANG